MAPKSAQFSMSDHYAVLGVSYDTTENRSSQHSSEEMVRLNVAYDVHSNEINRRKHDESQIDHRGSTTKAQDTRTEPKQSPARDTQAHATRNRAIKEGHAKDSISKVDQRKLDKKWKNSKEQKSTKTKSSAAAHGADRKYPAVSPDLMMPLVHCDLNRKPRLGLDTAQGMEHHSGLRTTTVEDELASVAMKVWKAQAQLSRVNMEDEAAKTAPIKRDIAILLAIRTAGEKFTDKNMTKFAAEYDAKQRPKKRVNKDTKPTSKTARQGYAIASSSSETSPIEQTDSKDTNEPRKLDYTTFSTTKEPHNLQLSSRTALVSELARLQSAAKYLSLQKAEQWLSGFDLWITAEIFGELEQASRMAPRAVQKAKKQQASQRQRIDALKNERRRLRRELGACRSTDDAAVLEALRASEAAIDRCRASRDQRKFFGNDADLLGYLTRAEVRLLLQHRKTGLGLSGAGLKAIKDAIASARSQDSMLVEALQGRCAALGEEDFQVLVEREERERQFDDIYD